MSEIYAPSVRYSLFAGESLPEDDAIMWSRSIPNARIDNLYGPTETTIYCTRYTFKRDKKNKEANGVLCIGKPYNNTYQIIIDENQEEVPAGTQGELCFAGSQLTPGYWNNPKKNNESFFIKNGMRFYRTGD